MGAAAIELSFEYPHARDRDAAADDHVMDLPFPGREPLTPPRQQYLDWVEEQIEEYKCSIRRDDLLALADHAVTDLLQAPDGQYALTEIVLCDAVDRIIFKRLKLPSYRKWLKLYRSDTPERPDSGTPDGAR